MPHSTLPGTPNEDCRRSEGLLSPGDLVSHPRHGFGTISGLTRRDPLHPIQDVLASEAMSDQTQDYYDIQLVDGGTLPVSLKAWERLGLRLLTNGVDAITACLRSAAQSLPGARKRAAELWARTQTGEATALAASVRDMLAQSHGRAHTASEKTWLDKSCARLSTEAALVDDISRSQAHTAMREAVNHIITG